MDEKIFNEYKNTTMKIINKLNDDEECLELMDSRKKIIEDIILSDYDKNMLKSIYKTQGLEEIDKCLENTIKGKLKDAKEAINKAAKGRQTLAGYHSAKKRQNFYSARI